MSSCSRELAEINEQLVQLAWYRIRMKKCIDDVKLVRKTLDVWESEELYDIDDYDKIIEEMLVQDARLQELGNSLFDSIDI